MARIVLPEKPAIIYTVILEETKKLIFELHNQITIDDFRDNIIVTSHGADKWHVFANATLRITENGCDKINITSIYALLVEYTIFYKGEYLATAQVSHSNNITSLINKNQLVRAINSNVCAKCRKVVKECKCHKEHKPIDTSVNLIDLNFFEDDSLAEKDVELNDETGIFDVIKDDNQTPSLSEVMNELEPTIKGFAVSYRIKNYKELLKTATEIVKGNVGITEQELIVELLRKGVK